LKTTYTWNNAMPRSQAAFTAGSLATYFGYASELSDLRAKNPHLNLDVTVVPQRDALSSISYGRIYAVAVMKNSQKPTPAFSVGTLMARTENQKTLAKVLSMAPARRDLLSAGNPDPFPAVFYRSAIGVRSWSDPNPVETDKIFREMVVSVGTGRSQATDAVSRADAELGNLIKK
jgi:ABC-type glycerol-3-phosphate transport system substrate-binding protein